MLYYDPRGFYTILLRVRGTVVQSSLLHSLLFACLGGLAAELVSRGWLKTDVNEVSFICGLVMSLLLTFRLTFSFNRYGGALSAVSDMHNACCTSIVRLCGATDPNDAAGREIVARIRRLLTLLCVFSKQRVRAEKEANFSTLESIGLLTAAERSLFEDKVIAKAHGESDGKYEAFPSKGRNLLVLQLIWTDLSHLLREGHLLPHQYISVDKEVTCVSENVARLDAMVAQVHCMSFE